MPDNRDKCLAKAFKLQFKLGWLLDLRFRLPTASGNSNLIPFYDHMHVINYTLHFIKLQIDQTPHCGKGYRFAAPKKRGQRGEGSG